MASVSGGTELEADHHLLLPMHVRDPPPNAKKYRSCSGALVIRLDQTRRSEPLLTQISNLLLVKPSLGTEFFNIRSPYFRDPVDDPGR